MSRIRKIISIYLSYRQPRSTRKEFAEWFAAPFDGETKQRLMREYWDALSPEMSQDRVQKAYARVRNASGSGVSRCRRRRVSVRCSEERQSWWQ